MPGLRGSVTLAALLALSTLAGGGPLSFASSAAAGIASGIDLIPGQIVAGDQPDGNTVVLRGSEGLIVVDVGRHVSHTQQIIDFADQLGQPVKVVVNTHWHLDHIGGNPLMREAFPGLKIIASGALEEAMTGFLATYRRQLEGAIADAGTPADARERYRQELVILDHGPQLLPDVVVTGTGERTLAGRLLEVHLETFAVSGGDLWLRDPATRTLIAGDLVTVPAPLFDTACPQRWQAALGRLAETDWVTLVPGHGAPMGRAAFTKYRAGFDSLLACAASTEPQESCVDGWLRDAGDLIAENDRPLARGMVGYYVDQVLRGPVERIKSLCGTL
jgi:glyoxylase-like metal-dependent hydrolase (beta-lactamase superfamily II)